MVRTRRLSGLGSGFDSRGLGFDRVAASLRAPPDAYGLAFMGVDEREGAEAGVWTKKLVEDESKRGREVGVGDTVGSSTSDSSLSAPPAAYGLTLAGVRVTLKRRPPSPGGAMHGLASSSDEPPLDGLVLVLATVVGNGASEEKLGGLLTMLIVSLRGIRRGCEGTTGVEDRTVAMMNVGGLGEMK